MPQTKQKPAADAAAPPIQPEPQKPNPTELREGETKRQFEALEGFARMFNEEMSLHDFQTLKTFKLILDRNRGSSTPIESFLLGLVYLYQSSDDNGKGLTLEDIQWEMRQELLDSDALTQTIKDAHFMASRYPLPEPTAEPTQQS